MWLSENVISKPAPNPARAEAARAGWLYVGRGTLLCRWKVVEKLSPSSTVSQNTNGTPSPLTGEGRDGGDNIACHDNSRPPPPPPPPPPGGGECFFL